jgi:hypothetical protein
MVPSLKNHTALPIACSTIQCEVVTGWWVFATDPMILAFIELCRKAGVLQSLASFGMENRQPVSDTEEFVQFRLLGRHERAFPASFGEDTDALLMRRLEGDLKELPGGLGGHAPCVEVGELLEHGRADRYGSRGAGSCRHESQSSKG